MMTQKGDPYIKMFSIGTLSEVRMFVLIFIIIILCISPVELYYCENNDSHIAATYLCSHEQDFITAERSIHKSSCKFWRKLVW